MDLDKGSKIYSGELYFPNKSQKQLNCSPAKNCDPLRSVSVYTVNFLISRHHIGDWSLLVSAFLFTIIRFWLVWGRWNIPLIRGVASYSPPTGFFERNQSSVQLCMYIVYWYIAGVNLSGWPPPLGLIFLIVGNYSKVLSRSVFRYIQTNEKSNLSINLFFFHFKNIIIHV